jgi:hypothetical protein
MNRFEKIVLEQQSRKSKLGDWGIYTGDWQSIAPDLENNGKKLVDDKSIDVVSFLWWIISENSDFRTIASNLTSSRQYGKTSQFANGKYIYVINKKITGKKSKGKPIEFWPVYIVPITSAPPNSTFKVGTSPVLSMEQYNTFKDTEKTRVDKPAVDTPTVDPIQQQKAAVDAVITKPIDVNNLGKGSEDAKAFQELLYQVGLKHLSKFPQFAKFVNSSKQNGSWDGDIGVNTLNLLDQVSLKEPWIAGKKLEVIQVLQQQLKITESLNYFKGTGMNVKLKDLLQEQLLNEQDVIFKIKPLDQALELDRASEKPSSSSSSSSSASTTKNVPKVGLWTGTYIWPNGNKYTGDWVDGRFYGKGTLSRKDGSSYTGDFENGKYHGTGTYTWPNGNKYTGGWVDNLRNGPGEFYNAAIKTTIPQTFKSGSLVKSNEEYWDIAKKWVDDEYKFWESGGTGPDGQARPKTHDEMFRQFNTFWDDYESEAKKAYLSNRRIALKWLAQQLKGTTYNYYSDIESWINKIADEIDDVFQNNVAITLNNDEVGDSIYRMVQAEIDVDW